MTIPSRQCDECKECCTGNLSIDELNVYRGSPCKYLCSTGCSVYTLRPINPCAVFNCGWKLNPTIPEEFRPDKSKVLVKANAFKWGNEFIDTLVFIEDEIAPSVMDWFKATGKNFIIEAKKSNGEIDRFPLGSIDFMMDFNFKDMRTI